MDDANVSEFLQSIQQSTEGWKAPLPGHITFFGHPIELHIQTMPIPKLEVRPPNSVELALATQVLSNLDIILAQAAKGTDRYLAEDRAYLDKIASAQIWINEDAIENDGPKRWSFVVTFSTSEDFGIHADFDGVDLLDVWGGD